MSLKEFKAYLKNQDHEGLMDELLTLYQTFEQVREFYTIQMISVFGLTHLSQSPIPCSG
jgi:hypothetical protein